MILLGFSFSPVQTTFVVEEVAAIIKEVGASVVLISVTDIIVCAPGCGEHPGHRLLPAQQGQPVDFQHRGTVLEPAHQAGKAF